MKKYQTILAYYSVIISSILLIWSIVFASRLEGIILALLLLPIGIYFWSLIAGKISHDPSNEVHQHTDTHVFGLLVTITLTIAVSSIIIYITSIGGQPKKDVSTRLSTIETTLSTIEKDMKNMKNDDESLKEIETKVTSIELSVKKLEKQDNKDILELYNSISEATIESTLKPTLKAPTPTINNIQR